MIAFHEIFGYKKQTWRLYAFGYTCEGIKGMNRKKNLKMTCECC